MLYLPSKASYNGLFHSFLQSFFEQTRYLKSTKYHLNQY